MHCRLQRGVVQLRGSKYADGSIVRSAAISLDGALDYEVGDWEEWTMELSLWAEGFRDMLCTQYGLAIYRALTTKWCALPDCLCTQVSDVPDP